MNVSIPYLLSKDAPAKGMFLKNSGFYESVAIAVGHGFNINYVMHLLCLGLDISDKDIPTPAATEVPHSHETHKLTLLTRYLSLGTLVIVLLAWYFYWCFDRTQVCFMNLNQIYLIVNFYWNCNSNC
jgi:hypothetical protein